MTEEPDLVVLREALRQGERILTIQDQTCDSIQRRANELLKLTVATLGGIIVVGGILSASSVVIDSLELVGFGAGISLIMAASAILAVSLAGGKVVGAFAHGPEPRRIAEFLEVDDITLAKLIESLVNAQPDWVKDNDRLMVRMQRINAVAVTALVSGALLFSLTLLYIVGGAILA